MSRVDSHSGDLFPLDTALRGIRERFADAVIDADRTSMRERTVVVPAERLAELADALAHEWGGSLVTLFGLDERATHGRFRLHVVFTMAPEDALVTLVAAVPEFAPRYPSIARVLPAASELERELQDLLGVHADGHPDPRRILMPDEWQGHPQRKDYPLEGPGELLLESPTEWLKLRQAREEADIE